MESIDCTTLQVHPFLHCAFPTAMMLASQPRPDMHLDSQTKIGRMTGAPPPSQRLRSQGGLTVGDLALYQRLGIELGFDPVQQAIVPIGCIDDIADNARGADITNVSAGRSLLFRRWKEDDAPTFVDLLGNERVWTYLPDVRPKLDLSSAVDLIRLSNEAEHHDVYAVEVAGVVVGQARLLFDLNTRVRDEAEISYWLGEQHWGQGIGSRIVQEFTRASFSKWSSLSAIVARVHKDNHASRQVLAKSGYVGQDGQSSEPWRMLRRSRS
jgi:RimJ/RimL family protein N-acetyltransferase